jgi:hypothetical protein
LIAFSNAGLFESRLVTFPTANDAEGQMGVRWVPVPDGVYDRGKTRTNAREAEKIAELVVEHWRTRAGRPGDLERRLRRRGIAPRGDRRSLPTGEGVRRGAEEVRLLDAVSRACQAAPSRKPPESHNRPIQMRVVSREAETQTKDGGRSTIPTRDFRTGSIPLSRALLSVPPHEAPPAELAPVFLQMAIEENGIARERAFRLPIPYQPAILRHGGDTPTRRDFVHVPPGELLLAVRSLLERNGVMARAELEREVTGIYVARVVLTARTWLSEVLERGVPEGRIALVENRIELVG